MQASFHKTTQRKTTQRAGVALLLSLAFAALMLSFNGLTPLDAQAIQPTGTPSDPAWRGFAAARVALEEEKSLDLTFVRAYSYEQTEWKTSIDTCVEATPVSDYRPVYFGWDYRITDFTNKVYKVRVSFDLKAVVICDKVEEAAAVGTGGDGSLPPPVAGGAGGGAFELGGHVSGFSSAATTAMRSAGMTWVKKQLVFRSGDTTGQAQAFLDEAKANGFKLLLGIVGDKSQMGSFDAYITDYSTFVGNVAALGVDAIEVWNEPNIDREWPAGQINGANYTKLLAAAYNAIKTKNANTLVISGAPAPTGFFGAAGCANEGCNDDAFMAQMAQAGAASYMDCVGLHYNEGTSSAGSSSGSAQGDNYPTRYFGTMLARGYAPFGGKPVCFTELGYLSGEGFTAAIPAGFAWAANTSLAEHAAWLAEAAVLGAQSSQVRLMIIWNVNFTRFDSDPMGGYAIIRPDGTCPACATLGTAMGG